ncbi:NAD(P)-binding domain-containing protein [Planomonospora sp. ID91781]|uniref:Dimethylaniline monooxygenase n=2 Tax=Planomonospora parontospora TaxID=58119 RepID=A0AA37BEB6_9ACTN|nr:MULTISPECIES: NAD(P)-binding domain-containing protein [Planomonospora]MBG0821007.1 NAD(P)-binding domain-containing protein [Planomonospora sp. ID91781]GGK58088.1 dimethylaniline monooxygenase [Planomonospora parontospora]GII07851.1 dimethylaniline monooxygenase [Planomonospora parontospora subsp. parontospora]
MRTPVIDVAVVGAGPYGLSVGAHAVAAGLDVRVYGRPMESWERHMPRGMLLKSEPAASNLADPHRSYGLDAYCRPRGLSCAYGEPVPVETFVDYGKWFRARTVGEALDPSSVTEIRPQGRLFAVELSTGETVMTRTVVLALGFLPFAHRPAVLSGLPSEICTHSSEHHDLSAFAGRDVTVVGAGQSALETATLLLEAGARPRVVARVNTLLWNNVPETRASALRRLLSPVSGLGTGWRSWIWSELPGSVRHLPVATRHRIVRTTLGPAGAWWLRKRFDGHVPVVLGQTLAGAVHGDDVSLTLRDENGSIRTVRTEHVIAATGYLVDVERMDVLDGNLRYAIRRTGTSPLLTRDFETSVSGLFAVGLAAAGTFGPVMRFVHGTHFAARRVTRGLVAAVRARSMLSGVSARPARPREYIG